VSPKQLTPFPRLLDADSLSSLEPAQLQQGVAFLMDKPEGRSSFWVVSRLRRICQVQKVGHAGTLDPFATGLLIVLMGKGTRHQDTFMGQSKCYETTFRLGQSSDTCDRTGTITQHVSGDCPFDMGDLERALDAQRGEITQQVPAYSAVKVGGKRLYKSARQGESVERPSRLVTVHAIEVLSFDWPLLQLRIRCSKGTYIRSIASDLGAALGTHALVQDLRRTESGEHTLLHALSIEAVEEELKHPRFEVHFEDAKLAAIEKRRQRDMQRTAQREARARKQAQLLADEIS
jgi:tRNA pseudouridine55 synthase